MNQSDWFIQPPSYRCEKKEEKKKKKKKEFLREDLHIVCFVLLKSVHS